MRWKYLKTVKKISRKRIWLIKNEKGSTGYFKCPLRHRMKQYRLMVANEYIAAALARRLGLPVAKLSQETVRGPKKEKMRGMVSVRIRATEVITWNQADKEVHLAPEHFVNGSDLLAQVVVFDTWILNPDRTSVNIVLYRNNPTEKYNWYLIDHGSALFGSPSKPPLSKRIKAKHPQLNKGIRLSNGIKSLILKNEDAVADMIQKIESLTKSNIKKAIKSVPKSHLSKAKERFIQKLLLFRKRKLRKIMSVILDQLNKNCRAVL
ncbi:HipA family kinase [Brevibacillus sp. NRS-1366]|uniref:HipA family kinase n=1 Tax=Brevibacillus sp. NRS-1366 TaxID=3233899 RepID=UPI003D216EA4